MIKTDTAWVLSLGLVSSGASELRRNGNSSLADGAISKILVHVCTDPSILREEAAVHGKCISSKTINGDQYVLQEEAEPKIGGVLLHDGP